MVGEGVLVSVFKDKIAFRMEDVLGENLVRNGLQAFKGIRRIREDNVELLMANGKEIEDIVPYHGHIVEAQPPGLGFDEGRILPGHLNGIYPGGSTGSKLEGYGSGAAEKVKHLQVFELIFIAKDVEKTFPGEIGRRPCLVTGRWVDSLAFQASSNDPHRCSTDLK